ncbi:MAG: flagellar hook-basal body complex protein [Acetobacteraceae bacterium]|nr:flagellar hook-basal body complex protein [Acetobacteraceae bacterium]MDW8399588.1 flagellar hook-basal body complex protein [Acetobacteraceae bacterium]
MEQSENPLAMAIAGQGFFAVAQARGYQGGLPTFDERQFYTRAGDFRVDRDGYLVNGQGYYLQGWSVDASGNPDRTQISPIRISQLVFNPIPTSVIELAANLPADATTAPVAAQIQVYDSLGRLRAVDMVWTNLGTNVWQLAINVPDDIGAPARGTTEVRFGQAATPPAPDGTIGEFANPTGVLAGSLPVPGQPASVTFDADFGQGPQPMTLNLGIFGQALGMTQFAGREYTVRNLSQDGVPLGSFAGLALRENGDLAINYDNGQTRVVARVPIVAFNDPDKLQRLDGQAFLRTLESGEARISDASANGAGKLISGSIERANVDIAAEFSKLIVAQRAYTANTRIVTASDEMLQEMINMRR